MMQEVTFYNAKDHLSQRNMPSFAVLTTLFCFIVGIDLKAWRLKTAL